MMYASNRNEYDIYSEIRRSENHSIEENFWTIQSGTQGQPPLLVSFVNESEFDHEICTPSSEFYATFSVQPLNSNTNLTALNRTKSRSFHKLGITVWAEVSGGSWVVKISGGDNMLAVNHWRMKLGF
jgi:hypothetical protein